MVKRTKRSMRGDGFFGDLWSGVKSAANWVKDNKIISKVGGLIPIPEVQTAAKLAGAVGLGRRRAHKHRPHKSKAQRGGSAVGAIALPGVRTSANSGLRL